MTVAAYEDLASTHEEVFLLHTVLSSHLLFQFLPHTALVSDMRPHTKHLRFRKGTSSGTNLYPKSRILHPRLRNPNHARPALLCHTIHPTKQETPHQFNAPLIPQPQSVPCS